MKPQPQKASAFRGIGKPSFPLREYQFEPVSKINVNVTEVNGEFKVWVQPKNTKVKFQEPKD